MNEKIKELMAEVGMSVDYLTNTKQIVLIEKFAELIVQECLDACSRANDIKHFVPPTQEQVVLSCMREIETTFRS